MLWTMRVSLPLNREVDCSSIERGVEGVGIGEYLINLWRVMRPPPVFVARPDEVW